MFLREAWLKHLNTHTDAFHNMVNHFDQSFTVGKADKNISAVKKGEPKKVQVTERPKDVI